jgi:hypothetical protein
LALPVAAVQSLLTLAITGTHCNRSASFCDLVFSNKGPPSNLSNPFVTKLNPTRTVLVYSTYLGGQATSTGMIAATALGITVNAQGNAYVVGSTYSSDFPLPGGAYQTTIHVSGGHDTTNAFVTEFDPAGTSLVYSTYLGDRCSTSGPHLLIYRCVSAD